MKQPHKPPTANIREIAFLGLLLSAITFAFGYLAGVVTAFEYARNSIR